MGARMARVLVQTIPESIERLILLSPPTIEFNQLVNFTTGTLLGSLVFKYVATNHSMLVVWLQRLHRWKILNRSVYLYSSKNIGEKQRMTKVYKTWTAQRMLRTNLAQIARLANKHKIELILIAGKNDALAPPYKMIKYIRNLFQKHKVFLVRKKHELVTPETIHLLRKLLIDS
jgi:pimeloyl-ACP methyl ester carboxylesterase